MPPNSLSSQTALVSLPAQPGVVRVAQAAGLSIRHCRDALQLSTPAVSMPPPGESQFMPTDRRSAQRVQSAWLPPQQRPFWHAPLAQSRSSRHCRPGAQRSQAGPAPPQSTSVSPALWTPSSQEMQAPPAQTLLAQSLPRLQRCPSRQRAQPGGPPQSVPVSTPLRVPSSQAATLHTPALQTLLAQSAPRRQRPPSGQRAHSGSVPPQSMSDSLAAGESPLATPSSQEAAWQHALTPTSQPAAPQVPLAQSSSKVQVLARGHLSHVAPQSTPVSSWFLIPSSQVAAEHTLSSLQTRLSQSTSFTHAAPVAQGAQSPPQSRPPSL